MGKKSTFLFMDIFHQMARERKKREGRGGGKSSPWDGDPEEARGQGIGEPLTLLALESWRDFSSTLSGAREENLGCNCRHPSLKCVELEMQFLTLTTAPIHRLL